MELTKNYLVKKFNEFNTKYFEGKLPLPLIQINHSYKAFGLCGFKGGSYNTINGTWLEQPKHYIKISNFHNRTEHEFLQTLLHEMIHLHFNVNGQIRVAHGKPFQDMARSFDKDGWNIHTCSTFDKTKDVVNETKENTLVSYLNTKDGKIWVVRVNEKYADRLINFIIGGEHRTNVRVYTSHNKMFGSYNLCRTRICGQTFTEEEFNTICLPHLKETRQVLSVRRR